MLARRLADFRAPAICGSSANSMTAATTSRRTAGLAQRRSSRHHRRRGLGPRVLSSSPGRSSGRVLRVTRCSYPDDSRYVTAAWPSVPRRLRAVHPWAGHSEPKTGVPVPDSGRSSSTASPIEFAVELADVFERILAATHLSRPADVGSVLAREAAALGAAEVVFYLPDYDQE